MGKKSKNIKKSELGDPVDIAVAILKVWIEGKGRMPVTWQTLVTCLQKTNLNVLADDIETVLSEHKDSDLEDLWPVIYECTSSFSHYNYLWIPSLILHNVHLSSNFSVNLSHYIVHTHILYVTIIVYIFTLYVEFWFVLNTKAIFILFHILWITNFVYMQPHHFHIVHFTHPFLVCLISIHQ